MTDEKEAKDDKLGGNEMLSAHARIGYADKYKVVLHERYAPDIRARFAISLLEKWGMVMAEEDGVSATGRQKTRRMTSPEVVEYACATAEGAFAEFQKRGWLVDIGDIDRLHELAKDSN